MLLEDNETNEQQVYSNIHKEADKLTVSKSAVMLFYFSSNFDIYKTFKA